MVKVPKCPLCNSELIEKVESVSVRGTASGSTVHGSSIDTYKGSIDVFITPGSEISIKYYRCSNPDCPYLRREIINNH